MSENELLLAISDIVEKNVKMLEKKMERMEERLSTRIDTVDAKIDAVDARLSKEIKTVRIQLENVIVPRLNTIEKCYTSTYDKYRDGVDRIETLEMNMDVMKSVVREYGEKLDAMTA